MSVLRATSSDLIDLAAGTPSLVEASGTPTGVRLLRYLGGGGMAAVFLAELEGARSDDLLSTTPKRLAIKFMRADTERELTKANIDPLTVFEKEKVALKRVASRTPPTEFVVGFYGSGRAMVSVNGGPPRALPWLAIECVEGGIDGTSLTDRVGRTPDGIDPIRALRLVRGLIEGVRVLHVQGVLHRDLKPDNVLVAGPVDDETPKLADCGIARIDGMVGMTIGAISSEWGGPEQSLSLLRQGHSNPLVGPWSDVHALAAVVWFILGGEPPCTGFHDKAWIAGERRSLRGATRLHPAFVMDSKLLAELDGVLARGASPRIPAMAWQQEGVGPWEVLARSQLPVILEGTERYADIESFASELIPRLERVATLWTSRAARGHSAPTAFRPTQVLLGTDFDLTSQSRATVRERAGSRIEGTHSTFKELPGIAPGNMVFQPDGKLLARFGERLVYFVSGEPHKVGVPDELRETVEGTRWVVRGPGGGFALVGPSHVLLIRGGNMTRMPLPSRASGEVGEVQAVVGDGRVFGVVTAETDDSNGGPELWKSADGTGWTGPTLLPLGGDVHAVADGPYGMLVVGSRKGTKGRALFLGLDGHTTVFATVNDKPKLSVAVASAGRECWAAGTDIVLRFDKASANPASLEKSEMHGAPTAMGLDIVGVPWLVTERAVLRRHIEANDGVWKVYHRRAENLPPLAGIGFTLDGAIVVDERGGIVDIEPHDIASWRRQAPSA